MEALVSLRSMFGVGPAGGRAGAESRVVEPGAVFRGVNERQSVEIAEVMGIQTDEFGVRHVRFRLFYRYQHRLMEAGERTLAMAAFTRRFDRRLESFGAAEAAE